MARAVAVVTRNWVLPSRRRGTVEAVSLAGGGGGGRFGSIFAGSVWEEEERPRAAQTELEKWRTRPRPAVFPTPLAQDAASAKTAPPTPTTFS